MAEAISQEVLARAIELQRQAREQEAAQRAAEAAAAADLASKTETRSLGQFGQDVGLQLLQGAGQVDHPGHMHVLYRAGGGLYRCRGQAHAAPLPFDAGRGSVQNATQPSAYRDWLPGRDAAIDQAFHR